MGLYFNLAQSCRSDSISRLTVPRDAEALRARGIRANVGGVLARYPTSVSTTIIDNVPFTLLRIQDTNALVDAISATEFEQDERFPYWAELWPSSVALAGYLHPSQGYPLYGQQVLELGCGLGLAGIAAAMAGAHVTFTDYEDDALAFAHHNASLNFPLGAPGVLRFLNVDWRDLPELGTFDMILGADIVYERRNFSPLINALRSLLSPRGVACFTDPGRSIGAEFFSLAAKEGLTLRQSERRVLDQREHRCVLWEIRLQEAAHG